MALRIFNFQNGETKLNLPHREFGQVFPHTP